jgi:hypothetical protein
MHIAIVFIVFCRKDYVDPAAHHANKGTAHRLSPNTTTSRPMVEIQPLSG